MPLRKEASGSVFLGLDLGTSALKACAVDRVGQLLTWSEAAYPTFSACPGWAEQRLEDWVGAAVAAVRDLLARLPKGAQPRALGLAGQLPTLVLLDDAGRAQRPAIVWYDGRATEEAAILLHRVQAGEWYRRSGVVLDAHYLAPMYAWVRAHEPELDPGMHRLCGAKDALLSVLTGAWLTDPSTASGYGVYAPLGGGWDTMLCAAAGLDAATLPASAAPWSVAGALGALSGAMGLPRGLPVVVGAADSLAGVLGCGGAAPRTLAAISGTSMALVVSTPAPALDPERRFFLTPHALPDLWGLEMDLMSSGSALRWLGETLDLPHAGDVYALAAQSPPGAHGVLALPYLAGGEQGALWDATARGAFVGLALTHGAADLARALLEGIACEMRRCVLAWEDAGVAVGEVVLAGARDAGPFTELVAAALDRPVRVAADAPFSAIGAALLAGMGVGAWDAATAQAGARAALGPPLSPQRDEATRYAALYERYARVSEALRRWDAARA